MSCRAADSNKCPSTVEGSVAVNRCMQSLISIYGTGTEFGSLYLIFCALYAFKLHLLRDTHLTAGLEFVFCSCCKTNCSLPACEISCFVLGLLDGGKKKRIWRDAFGETPVSPSILLTLRDPVG